MFDTWYSEKGTFNFTLFKLPLENSDQIKYACEVLKDMKPEIQEFLNKNGLQLNVKGVGDFKLNERESNILFAKLQENKGFKFLCDIAEMILDRFVKEGLIFPNEVVRQPFHLILVNSSYTKIEGQFRGFNGKLLKD